jgi:thiamine biosynthesis protein ThiS
MIAVCINNKERHLSEPTTLMEYLSSQGVSLRHIAVAYNGTVLRKEELSGVTLSEGDQVELVRAVGGG